MPPVNQTYPSKIDGWFLALACLPVVVAASTIVFRHSWAGTAMVFGITGLVFVPMLLNTYYRISSHLLHVQCGLIVSMDIDILSITHVRAVRSIWSAPALSAQRLEIRYNKYDSILVSPRQQAEFVAALKQINPGISIAL